MNALDYGLLAVLLFFLLWGYGKGFFRQVLLVAGIGVSLLVAAHFHTSLATTGSFSKFGTKNTNTALVISFLTLLFASMAVTSTLASLLGRRLTNVHLRSGDRWLGALLGFLFGVIAVGGICIGLLEWKAPGGVVGEVVPQRSSRPSGDDGANAAAALISHSVLAPHFADACLMLVALVPQSGRDQLTRLFEQKVLLRSSDPSPSADRKLSSDRSHRVSSTPTATDPQRRRAEPRPPLNLGLQRQIVKREQRRFEQRVPRDADERLDFELEGKPVPASAQDDELPRARTSTLSPQR